MPARRPESAEIFRFADGAEWERWLETAHSTASEAWLLIGRKNLGADSPVITISAALDGALSFGWIDSIRLAYDSGHFLQRYSPRRPRSPLSAINRARVAELGAMGQMRDAGLAVVHRR
jgi:uncharacterized protein YdeI (YjbR/CyaY-like superfamily)